MATEGYGIDQVMRFTVWLLSRQSPVAAADVMGRFNCSRATAYKWMRLFEDVAPQHAAKLLRRKKYTERKI